MNMASETVRAAVAGFVTLCALAAAGLVLFPAAPTADISPELTPMAASGMVDAELADVIAAQGNAALKQIRAESTRLAPPDLRDVAVEGESGAAEP